MLKYKLKQLVALAHLLLLPQLVSPVLGNSTPGGDGPRTEVSERTDISNNVKTETVKVGNTKTKNYHIEAAEYRPTQLTQVVLNVPKLPKYLRKTRPPTEEELMVKERILEVFQEVRHTIGVYVPAIGHLQRILESLNPKYISTERVVRAVFQDQPPPFQNRAEYVDEVNNQQALEEQRRMQIMLEDAQRQKPIISAAATASASAVGSAAASAIRSPVESYDNYGYSRSPDHVEPAGQLEYEVNTLAGRYFQSPMRQYAPPTSSHRMSRYLPKLNRHSSYTSAPANEQQQQFVSLHPGGGHSQAYEQQQPQQHYARY